MRTQIVAVFMHLIQKSFKTINDIIGGVFFYMTPDMKMFDKLELHNKLSNSGIHVFHRANISSVC